MRQTMKINKYIMVILHVALQGYSLPVEKSPEKSFKSGQVIFGANRISRPDTARGDNRMVKMKGHNLKVNLNLKRLRRDSFPKISMSKYHKIICSAVAFGDLLFWILHRFDLDATALLSDKYFSLRSWQKRQNLFDFLIRIFLYPVGHGNLFHFLGELRLGINVTEVVVHIGFSRMFQQET